MRTTLLCLLAALAANALFGWWGRSTFVPLGLVVVGGLLLSILLGVLAAVIHGFSKRTPDRDTRLTLRMLLVGVVFFSSTLLGLPLVQRLIKADVAATRTEVENLAAALERYYTQHGRYPEALDERILTTPLSPLLRGRESYRSHGTSYVFRIRIPGNPVAGEIYRSQDRTWRLD